MRIRSTSMQSTFGKTQGADDNNGPWTRNGMLFPRAEETR